MLFNWWSFQLCTGDTHPPSLMLHLNGFPIHIVRISNEKWRVAQCWTKWQRRPVPSLWPGTLHKKIIFPPVIKDVRDSIYWNTFRWMFSPGFGGVWWLTDSLHLYQSLRWEIWPTGCCFTPAVHQQGHLFVTPDVRIHFTNEYPER